MNPLVTVLMPVYNGDNFLMSAVDSVLSQDFAHFELVIVDDGSTDGSARLLASLNDPRVRVLSQTNGGMSAALNAGLRAARGELVARMDQDDLALPGRLQQQADFLTDHPDVSVVGSRFVTLDEAGVTGEVADVLLGPDELHRDLFVRCPLGHGTVMARRAVLDALGGYDGSKWPAEDYDLWHRLMQSHRAANLPEVLYAYRIYARNRYSTRDAAMERQVQAKVWNGNPPRLTRKQASADVARYRAATAPSDDLVSAYVVQHWKLLLLLLARRRWRESAAMSHVLLLAPVLIPRFRHRARSIVRKMFWNRWR